MTSLNIPMLPIKTEIEINLPVLPFQTELNDIKLQDNLYKRSIIRPEYIKKHVDESYNYPFEDEFDLKNYITYSGLVNKIFDKAKNKDEVLIKSLFLDESKYVNDNNIFKKAGYQIKEFESIDEIENEFKKSECKNIFTEYITEYFNDISQEYLARLQYLINKIFTDVIDLYKKKNKINKNDLVFLFKGGTPMKMLYKEYEKIIFKNKESTDQSYNAEDLKIIDNFNKFFIKNDSDYSININPNIDEEQYKKIYFDITKISTLAILYIKQIIIENKNFFIPESIYDTQEKQVKIINDLNKKLIDFKSKNLSYTNNECNKYNYIDKIIGITIENNNVFLEQFNNPLNIDILVDETNESVNINDKYIFLKKNGYVPASRESIVITSDNDKKKIFFKNISNDKNNIYVTINDTLQLNVNNELKQSFLLLRIKYNIILYYIKTDNTIGFFSIPANIIDVAIDRQKCLSNKLLFNNDISKQIVNYSYKYDTDIEINKLLIKFIGYSYIGFIYDIVRMLFIESIYPWNNKKYEKRIYKLLYFIYIDLIINKKVNIIPTIIDYINSNNDTIYEKLLKELNNTATLYFIINYKNVLGFPFLIYNTEHIELKKKITDILTLFNNNNKDITIPKLQNGSIIIHQLGGTIIKKKFIKYFKKNNKILN